MKEGLISEKAFGSWEDSLLLNSWVPYTNVLHLKALKCIDSINKRLNKPKTNLYQIHYEKIFKLVESNV